MIVHGRVARPSKRTAGAGPCGMAARLNFGGPGARSPWCCRPEWWSQEPGEAVFFDLAGGVTRRDGRAQRLLVLQVCMVDLWIPVGWLALGGPWSYLNQNGVGSEHGALWWVSWRMLVGAHGPGARAASCPLHWLLISLQWRGGIWSWRNRAGVVLWVVENAQGWVAALPLFLARLAKAWSNLGLVYVRALINAEGWGHLLSRVSPGIFNI